MYSNNISCGGVRDQLDTRGSPNGMCNGDKKLLIEKYKAMRDTAIDIGKWVKGGKVNEIVASSQTKHEAPTPFLE